MESSIGDRFIFIAATGTHWKQAHSSFSPVVRKVADNGKTRPTIGAIHKGIIQPVTNQFNIFKAILTDCNIGVRVTLRRERMYEFLDRLISVSLPRIRDFKGIEGKMDGRGNYTLGIPEQIIFPEIVMDKVTRINGMNITFVTTADSDEEGYALLKELGLPFKNAKKI